MTLERPSPGTPVRAPATPDCGGVSIVFPVHNESFIIEQTLRNYIAELGARLPDCEFIVCEDGSTDDTKAVLERLTEELGFQLYLSNERKGYQRAVMDAVARASKPWVFVVDSDYQFAAIDYWRLEPYRLTHDIILGIKRPRRDPFYRVWLSAGQNWLLRRFFNVPYRDMDTGFRLFRKVAYDAVAGEIRHLSFFTAEFVVRAHHAGFRIHEVPVHHYARKIGSTTIFFISGLFAICVRQFAAILRMHAEFRRRRLFRPRQGRQQDGRGGRI
ncbi:MAG: glycosyltransferase family 2 protein [Bryobacteraceae bacterium]|nr:glycosyltransferase family 2 protein [Bryobacteraceae bacterium]